MLRLRETSCLGQHRAAEPDLSSATGSHSMPAILTNVHTMQKVKECDTKKFIKKNIFLRSLDMNKLTHFFFSFKPFFNEA